MSGIQIEPEIVIRVLPRLAFEDLIGGEDVGRSVNPILAALFDHAWPNITKPLEQLDCCRTVDSARVHVRHSASEYRRR